jgi:4-amino-4-deoxy-L-arabinose transferase-like glycosyltransferase
LLLALGALAAWALAVAAINTAQPGDHIEQFVWAQELAWGYPKHPPLPTWLLIAAESAFGRWTGWPYLLAGASLSLTATLTWALARRLIGAPAAGLAVLLWGLQQPFSRWAHLYNHNTVLVLAVALAAWCVWHALPSDRPAAEGSGRGGRAAGAQPHQSLGWAGPWIWWALAGVAAAGAMLAKYQALVPLAGLAVTALLAGHRAGRLGEAAGGLALASAVGAAALVPHAAWLLQSDFAPLRYAAQHAEPMSAAERVTAPLGFALQQVRMLLPALLLAAMAAWALRPAPAAGASIVADAATAPRAWTWGLVLVPVGLTLAAAPLAGVRLQNHWGTQALQFAALPLAAWALRPRLPGAPGRPGAARGTRALLPLLLPWALLHLGGILEKSREAWDPPTADDRPSRRLDGQYPAAALAAAAARDWHAVSGCPPAWVAGPVFEAGLVSVYWPGGQRPPVRTGPGQEGSGPAAAPSLGTTSGHVSGVLFIGLSLASLPAGLARYGEIPTPAAMRGTPGAVHWGVQPAPDCAGPAAGPAR